MVLLVGAGLIGKSFYRLLHVDLGFEPDHLATMQIAIPQAEYAKNEQIIAVARQIIGRIAGMPGVKSVGTSSVLPVSFNGNTTWIRFVGKPYSGEHNEFSSGRSAPDISRRCRRNCCAGATSPMPKTRRSPASSLSMRRSRNNTFLVKIPSASGLAIPSSSPPRSEKSSGLSKTSGTVRWMQRFGQRSTIRSTRVPTLSFRSSSVRRRPRGQCFPR